MSKKTTVNKVCEGRTDYRTGGIETLRKLDKSRLIKIIEELEDTIDLLKAEREATGFIPYEEFRAKLKEMGKI